LRNRKSRKSLATGTVKTVAKTSTTFLKESGKTIYETSKNILSEAREKHKQRRREQKYE